MSYREALMIQESDRTLYLAVPDNVYDTFFDDEFIARMISKFDVKLITYNIEKEEIIKWIK